MEQIQFKPLMALKKKNARRDVEIEIDTLHNLVHAIKTSNGCYSILEYIFKGHKSVLERTKQGRKKTHKYRSIELFNYTSLSNIRCAQNISIQL